MKTNRRETSIVVVCPICGEEHFIFANVEDVWAWEDGELVQNAFPYLSADEREILISGICPECWAKMFGDGE